MSLRRILSGCLTLESVDVLAYLQGFGEKFTHSGRRAVAAQRFVELRNDGALEIMQ